jgi:hypothetical protein
MLNEAIKIIHSCMENKIQYRIQNSPPLIWGMFLNITERWVFEISETTVPSTESQIIEVNNAFVICDACLRAEDNN